MSSKVTLLFLILFFLSSTTKLCFAQQNDGIGIEPVSHPSYQSESLQDEQHQKKGIGKLLFRAKNKVERLTLDFSSLTSLIINDGEQTKKTHWAAIAGFMSSLASLFIAGIPLGVLGFVFSFIALRNIYRNPSKYSGKVAAIIGLFLGIIGIFGGVVAITGM
jgi:asparagine N-glycosylation enzyme membrane subunit Stt3